MTAPAERWYFCLRRRRSRADKPSPLAATTGSSQALASQALASLSALAGQTLDGVDVLSGGTYLVKSDGTAINTTVDGGTFAVQSGGVADTTALNTGVMNVSAGGIAIGTTISSGGRESVGGTDLGGIVNDGGNQTVLSGGFASGTLSERSRHADRFLGRHGGWCRDQRWRAGVFGSALATTIEAGQQFVSRGGLASGTTVGFGGAQPSPPAERRAALRSSSAVLRSFRAAVRSAPPFSTAAR